MTLTLMLVGGSGVISIEQGITLLGYVHWGTKFCAVLIHKSVFGVNPQIFHA